MAVSDDRPLFMPDRAHWRRWLAANHGRSSGVWLLTRKKNSKATGILYGEALDEALCFGWIDSQIRSLDRDFFQQRYTPRKPDSAWSLVNKTRVQRLVCEGLMAAAGLAAVEAAKARGVWQKAYTSRKRPRLPTDLRMALAEAAGASANWKRFPPSTQTQYVGYVTGAKRPDTRVRHVQAVVTWTLAGLKPGLQRQP